MYIRQAKIAMGVIPEYEVMNTANVRSGYLIDGEHELIRGLREMVQARKQSFWCTFALQVFLDIRHTLRENVTMAFGDLKRGAEVITRDIRFTKELHKTLGVDGDERAEMKALGELRNLVNQYTRLDFVGDLRGHLFSIPGEHEALPEFYLLERDPL